MRPRAVDRNHADVVKALRAAGVRVWDTHELGGGFPDLVCWRAATGYVLLEVKDGSKPPSARKLTDDEIAFGRMFPVAVVCDEREALAAVGLVVKA